MFWIKEIKTYGPRVAFSNFLIDLPFRFKRITHVKGIKVTYGD